MAATAHFLGYERELQRFSGARAVRVVHPPHQEIDDHAHPWPCLTLQQLGAYTEESEAGVERIAGPAAVLQPSGSAHTNHIAERGLETISIMFDPAWLGARALKLDGPRCWKGGAVGAAARQLAVAWSYTGAEDTTLRALTRTFLQFAEAHEPDDPPPAWFASIDGLLDCPDANTSTLARALAISPDVLRRTYRRCAGEGLRETLRRRRIERAACLIRSGETPLVEIAAEMGFSDQSHLNRECRALLGRSPGELAMERHTNAQQTTQSAANQ